jgi:phospholipase D1/2
LPRPGGRNAATIKPRCRAAATGTKCRLQRFLLTRTRSEDQVQARRHSREPPERKAPSLLRPGRNVWSAPVAGRAAVLVDAAAYYGMLRRVLRNARHSVIITGWDIDSRTLLVGPDGETGDDLPAAFGDFLTALARRRPQLCVKLLLWDYYMAVYSLERELMPALALQWNTPRQIELCLDDVLPIGASHHQKIVVVDDAVAFSGGIDITIRRWDTSAHEPHNPLRRDPAGRRYPPFHDVQLMVDGAAAAALGRLVRNRWYRVTHEQLPPDPPGSDPWPADAPVDVRDVAVGIARTEPGYGREPAVREVEALFHDMIGAAERHLYIENQFLTCTALAKTLAQRLREQPALEAVIVAPKTHHTWLEQQGMLAGRIRFMRILEQAGLRDRVRFLYPAIEQDDSAGDDSPDDDGPDDNRAEVMVHAKVMIVDDRLLRVGSANLCNRSVAVDTECDLVLAAETADQRAAVTAARNRLIAEHTGADPRTVMALLEKNGSLFATLDALQGRAHRLLPIRDRLPADTALGSGLSAQLQAVADPVRALSADRYLVPEAGGEPPSQRRISSVLLIGCTMVAVLALVLAWRYTPLSDWASPARLAAAFRSIADSPLSFPAVVGIFILAGFLAFPVTLLIAATAVTFGAWEGFTLALTGSMSSALATYGAGRWIGADLLRRVMGPRINRVARKVKSNGILAVTTMRVMPTAPFMLINLVAGATRIRLFDYAVGTILGMVPGIAIMSVLGGRLLDMMTQPSLLDLLLIVGFLLVWIGLSYLLQFALARLRDKFVEA